MGKNSNQDHRPGHSIDRKCIKSKKKKMTRGEKNVTHYSQDGESQISKAKERRERNKETCVWRRGGGSPSGTRNGEVKSPSRGEVSFDGVSQSQFHASPGDLELQSHLLTLWLRRRSWRLPGQLLKQFMKHRWWTLRATE